MSFAIEVVGEAAPLSLEELFRTLQLASSHDHQQRQSATQQLETWQGHAEFYPALQTLYLDPTIPREARFLAVIQLKNGVERQWRTQVERNPITPASKQRIRSRLFQGTIGQEDRQLALQNVLLTAKVVRMDYPQDWPDAISTLIGLLRDAKEDPQQLHKLPGTLLLLLGIVKQLGSARLRKSQTALQSAAPELVFVLCEIYGARTSQWIDFVTDPNRQGDDNTANLALDSSLTAFKILRRLLVVGWEIPHADSSNTVHQVWSFSQSQFDQFLGFVNHDSPIPASYRDMIGKHLTQFTKLHLAMAEEHPASFASLPNSLGLAKAYWDLVARFAEVYDKSAGIRQQSSSSGETKTKMEGPLLEKLALKGLLLMRACVRMVFHKRQTIKYRSKEIIQEADAAMALVKTEFFKDDLIIQMANAIITHLFVFRKADLDEWEDDPQEWEQQGSNEGNAYDWEVRPCSEKLFLDLLTHYKHLLLEPLLSYFATIANPQTDIAAKEAVYTAMGIAAPIVCDDFDFYSVLKAHVVSDAQYSGPYCQILRRRIAILLGSWVPIKITEESRPMVYEIFRHFLRPSDSNNDIVVRITAARKLKDVIDEFTFTAPAFLPFAPDILKELINLLAEVEIDETKLAILETTRSLIERIADHASEFGDFVISALPGIWASAGELGYLLKQSVLSILSALVMAMRTKSQRYHPQVIPLLAEATQEGTELYKYLIEEALDLWTNTVSITDRPLSADMIALARPAIEQLVGNNEYSFNYITILNYYITLAPESMLNDEFRNPLLSAISVAFDTKSREQLFMATLCTEKLLRYAHDLGGDAGFQLVVNDMVDTGFFNKLLLGIHDAHQAHQTSGPNRKISRVGTITLTDYFTILARIIIISPTVFVEKLVTLGALNEIWEWFSAEWFYTFDSMADVERQKLHLLAMTRLLELPSPVQELGLGKLQDYFNMWTIALTQILDRDSEPGADLFVLREPLEGSEYDTPKDDREREMAMTDPVKTLHSLQFVQERLTNLISRVGGEEAFAEGWLVNVDKEVIAGFRALEQGQF